ncbi:hypothetical protein [Hyphomonas sp.]|uniref:hypothetical protein n=1 Tax=Hyphomonas sp. TaxID=87 RepID=UPI00391D392B
MSGRNIERSVVFSIALSGMLFLGACPDSGSSQRSPGSPAGVQRLDDFCRIAGLDERTRHTVVVVDEHILTGIEESRDMPLKNGAVQQRLRDYISTDVAVPGGVIEPRERVSVNLAPIDGAPAKLMFTGCVPGVSSAERTGISENRLEVFAGGGLRQQIEEGENRYRTLTTLTLSGAARATTHDGSAVRKPAAEVPVLKSLADVALANRSLNSVVRYVIIADLSQASLGGITDIESARKAGFEAGLASGYNFHGSDILIAATPGSNEPLKQFYDAMLLAANGRLIYWGDGRPTQSALAPVSIQRFSGVVKIPDHRDSSRFDELPLNIRLAWDTNGDLTQSFVQTRGRVERIVPITGRVLCDRDVCRVRSDDGGFAQAWSVKPGGSPEFTGDMPFGGARDIELTIEGETVTGAISDSVMRLNNGEVASVEVVGQLQPEAVF